MWFIVAAAAIWLSKPGALTMLLVVVAVSWVLQSLCSPAWTAWMNDLVPKGLRARYFSRRSLLIGLFSLVAAPLAGHLLDIGEKVVGPATAFALLFLAAGVFGTADGIALLRQPEPPPRTTGSRPSLNLEYFRAPLRDKPFARFLLVFALWVFAQSIAGPFYAVYQLEVLKMSFFEVQILSGVAAAVTLLTLPAVGYLTEKYGNAPIYTIAYGALTITPLFWVGTRAGHPGLSVTLLVIGQAISGAAGAGMGISQFNLLLSLSPGNQMARYTAVWGTIVGAAGFAGPLVGGAIADAAKHANIALDPAGWDIGPYKFAFITSCLLRLAIAPMLKGFAEERSAGVRDVLGRMAGSKPLSSMRHLRRMRGATSPGKRGQSALALGRMKERLAFEELVEALEDPALAVRRQAAIALGELGDPRAVEPLLAKIRNPAAGSRTQAAVALGRLGDDRAVDDLIAALQSDAGRDTAFVQAVAQSLGHLRAARAAQPLLDIAEEAENPARAAAIQSLGNLGAEEAAEPLTEMLRTDVGLEPQEVSALGDALAKLGEESAIVPLLERIGDSPSSLMRRDLATNVGALIGPRGELYALLALDEFAREAEVAQMLTTHARTLRRQGSVSAALRAEAALETLGDNDAASTLRHLLIGAHKAAPHARGVAHEALEWLTSQSRTRDLYPEELLLGLYSYNVLTRR
jgi:HEAT repeat protein/MFS family permease